MGHLNIESGKRQQHTSIDWSISCIRFIAFTFIIICHILQYFGNGLCWWFNVGVQIFLAISGYLYGTKQISNDIEFYRRKFKQILVPYYITVFPFILIQLIFFKNLIDYKRIFMVLLCNKTLEGGEHLWFIPTILVCYLLTPFLYRLYISSSCLFKTMIMTLLGIVIMFKFFVPYFNPAWISCYAISFTFGYAEKNRKMLLVGRMQIGVVLLAILCNSVQIIMVYMVKPNFVENIKNGFQLFCNYSHVLLGIAIFILLRGIFQRLLKLNIIPHMPFNLFNISDKYSYEGYLVHQFFILGPMSLMNITINIYINILIALILIFILTFFIKIIENHIFGK